MAKSCCPPGMGKVKEGSTASGCVTWTGSGGVDSLINCAKKQCAAPLQGTSRTEGAYLAGVGLGHQGGFNLGPAGQVARAG